MTRVYTITTSSTTKNINDNKPPIINEVACVEEPIACSENLPKTAEIAPEKCAEIFSTIESHDPVVPIKNSFDYDNCNITEVIEFMQKLAKSPGASPENLAFSKHLANALIQIREEKLKRKASIPKKLEDNYEPLINIEINDFQCNALCDLGSSVSVMPKKLYDLLELPPLGNGYFNTDIFEIAGKKPLGKIRDIHVMVHNNLVPVDFVVVDVGYNAACPIIFGRPFLRTVGAIIDMKEGQVRFNFPMKKGMAHFPRKRKIIFHESLVRAKYEVDASLLDIT
jgi:hypothetical protein